jgi:hypothetical protein
MHLQARLFEERPPSENTLAYSNLARALTLNDTRPDPVTPVRVWQRPSPREDRLVLATPADRYVAPTGRDTHIRVRDPLRPNDDDPQPVTLRLWRPQSDGELLAQVFLDGQPRHEALHAPGLSAIELGPVTAGDHVLRIELYVRSEPEGAFVPVTSATGPSPLLFANHPVTNAPGDKAAPGRLVHARTALPLRAGRSASLEINHGGLRSTVINAQLIAPPHKGEGAPGRDRVHVTLERIAPPLDAEPLGARVDAHARTFSIARPRGRSSFTATGEALGPGQTFYVSISSELPPGRYRVAFTLDKDSTPETRLLRALILDDRPTELSESYFARLNVDGPVRVRVAADTTRLLAEGLTSLRFVYRVQGLTGEAVVRAATVDLTEATAEGAPAGALDLAIPSGLHTLTVGTLGAPAPVQLFLVDRYLDALAGREVLVAPPVTEALLPLPVRPESTRRQYEWLAAPGETPPQPARFVVPLRSRTEDVPLRLTAVRVLDEVDEALDAEVSIVVRGLSEDGKELFRTQVSDVARTARALRDLDAPLDRPSVLTEPRFFYVRPTTDTAALEVTSAAGAALLRVESLTDGEPIRVSALSPPPETVPGIRVRDALIPTGRWSGVSATREDRALRARPHEVERTRAFVYAVEEPVPTERFGSATFPTALERRGRLLEPVAAGRLLEHSEWGDTVFHTVHAGDRVSVVVPETTADPGRSSRVYYDLGSDVPEDELRVTLDGEEFASVLPLESKGLLKLPPLTPGEHEISFLCSNPRATFYLNLPPKNLEQARPLRERSTFSVAADARFTLRLDKQPGQTTSLGGALYLKATPPPGARIEARITAQSEQRVQGVATPRWTWLDRVILPVGQPIVEVIDVDGFVQTERRVHPFSITLHEDLHPGTYEIELRFVGLPACEARLLTVRDEPAAFERVRLRAVFGDTR